MRYHNGLMFAVTLPPRVCFYFAMPQCMLRNVALLVCLLVWMPIAAAAQWLVGGHIGAAFGTGGNSEALRVGPVASLNVAYRYDDNIRFGLESSLAIQGTNDNQNTYPEARLNSLLVLATVDYAFADFGFQPFFGMGAGAMFRNGRFERDGIQIEQNDVVPVVVPYIGTRLIIGPHFETDLRATFISTLSAGIEDGSEPFRGAFIGVQAGISYRF